jgi:hypothetical protein
MPFICSQQPVSFPDVPSELQDDEPIATNQKFYTKQTTQSAMNGLPCASSCHKHCKTIRGSLVIRECTLNKLPCPPGWLSPSPMCHQQLSDTGAHARTYPLADALLWISGTETSPSIHTTRLLTVHSPPEKIPASVEIRPMRRFMDTAREPEPKPGNTHRICGGNSRQRGSTSGQRQPG